MSLKVEYKNLDKFLVVVLLVSIRVGYSISSGECNGFRVSSVRHRCSYRGRKGGTGSKFEYIDIWFLNRSCIVNIIGTSPVVPLAGRGHWGPRGPSIKIC